MGEFEFKHNNELPEILILFLLILTFDNVEYNSALMKMYVTNKRHFNTGHFTYSVICMRIKNSNDV